MSTVKTYVTPLQAALDGFKLLEPKPATREPAGDTLDRAARLLMERTPGMTYSRALHDVLEVDPELKLRYHEENK